MNALAFLSASYLVLAVSGCSSIDPRVIEALAQDNASVCASGDIRGGAGSVLGGAGGGYGQSTLSFCRSNHNNAIITLTPDGAISIRHGATP